MTAIKKPRQSRLVTDVIMLIHTRNIFFITA
jgi:hypothetical protein